MGNLAIALLLFLLSLEIKKEITFRFLVEHNLQILRLLIAGMDEGSQTN